MKEQLISFETAKLAKEKGCIYSQPKINHDNTIGIQNCTQSLLQKWLREEHQIHIREFYGSYGEKWSFQIEPCNSGNKPPFVSDFNFETYELALETGLRKALKLI